MARVTPEIVKHVALLARLRLEGGDLEKIAAQLDEILEYVAQLQEIPTEQVEPTSHVLPLANVMRKDTPIPSLQQDAVVRLAPDTQPPFVKVPKVIATE